MTAMDLNLLPSGAKFQASKVKLQKRVNKIIIWIVSGWVGVGLIILGLTVAVKWKTATAETQLKKAQSDYSAMSSNIITSQSLKYRAKIVGQVLNSRFEYGKAFEAINSLFPTGVQLTDFKLSDKGGFELSATTDGSGNMDKMETLVDDINNGSNEEFKDAKITALSYSAGTWTLGVEVHLK